MSNIVEFQSAVPHVVGSNDTISVHSPFDGSCIGTVEEVNSVQVEQALVNAHEVFEDKKNWLSNTDRILILKKTAELMQERYDDLVELAVLEGAKPYNDSCVEMDRAIDGVLNCIELIRNEAGTQIPMSINPASEGRIAFTQKEPRGVVLAFSAFNHPINLIVHQVAPAVATGCPVIVKPASDTPLSAFAFCELLHEAGLPKEWCQPIALNNLDLAGDLVSDSRLGFFSFIGSAKVGWMLKSRLAPGVHCALEHGGSAPVIVAEDADLSDMLPLVAKGGFYHAGQVCVSVQRVFVHKSLIDQVKEGLVEFAKGMKVGDPLLIETEVGPLIRHAEVKRVESWVNEAVSEGAELAVGGQAEGDCFYQPTVLVNPAKTSKVSQLEIFGPVICLYEYTDIDKAISQANSLPFAFQSSIFTKNIDTALMGWKALEATAVMVNDHTAFRVDWMPFAGHKQSGYGTGGIPYTFRDMQVEKMVVIRSPSL